MQLSQVLTLRLSGTDLSSLSHNLHLRRSSNPLDIQKREVAMKKGTRSSSRKYGKKASAKVGRAMHEMKRGKLKSGRSGKKVKSRKQAIAIGLSEARRSGAKVPPKKKAARR